MSIIVMAVEDAAIMKARQEAALRNMPLDSYLQSRFQDFILQNDPVYAVNSNQSESNAAAIPALVDAALELEGQDYTFNDLVAAVGLEIPKQDLGSLASRFSIHVKEHESRIENKGKHNKVTVYHTISYSSPEAE